MRIFLVSNSFFEYFVALVQKRIDIVRWNIDNFPCDHNDLQNLFDAVCRVLKDGSCF